MSMEEREQRVLAHLSDGALHNVLAWPITNDVDGLDGALNALVAGWMLGKGWVSEEGSDDNCVWLRITEAGRRARALLSQQPEEG